MGERLKKPVAKRFRCILGANAGGDGVRGLEILKPQWGRKFLNFGVWSAPAIKPGPVRFKLDPAPERARQMSLQRSNC